MLFVFGKQEHRVHHLAWNIHLFLQIFYIFRALPPVQVQTIDFIKTKRDKHDPNYHYLQFVISDNRKDNIINIVISNHNFFLGGQILPPSSCLLVGLRVSKP